MKVLKELKLFLFLSLGRENQLNLIDRELELQLRGRSGTLRGEEKCEKSGKTMYSELKEE